MSVFLSLCIALLPFPAEARPEEEPVEELLPRVAGRVTLTDADGATVQGVGVRLKLTCTIGATPRIATADARGAFWFEAVPTHGCTIVTDLQGFKSAKAEVEAADADGLEFHLEVEPIFAGVTVRGGVRGDRDGVTHGVTKKAEPPSRAVRDKLVAERSP